MWAAIESISAKIGCVPQTLHEWVRKHEVDAGARPGITSDERERVKPLSVKSRNCAVLMKFSS